MSNDEPKSEHKFSFGLWTVGNIGRDPFGEPTRKVKTSLNSFAYSQKSVPGVNFHDNDLVPIAASNLVTDPTFTDALLPAMILKFVLLETHES